MMVAPAVDLLTWWARYGSVMCSGSEKTRTECKRVFDGPTKEDEEGNDRREGLGGR